MILKKAKIAQKVKAKTNGHKRLICGKIYNVIYPATDGNKFVFLLDETNNVNGYHIRNFCEAI